MKMSDDYIRIDRHETYSFTGEELISLASAVFLIRSLTADDGTGLTEHIDRRGSVRSLADLMLEDVEKAIKRHDRGRRR
jgi:hypothetical protein